MQQYLDHCVVLLQQYYPLVAIKFTVIIKSYWHKLFIDRVGCMSWHNFVKQVPHSPKEAAAFLLYIYMGLIRIPLAT